MQVQGISNNKPALLNYSEPFLQLKPDKSKCIKSVLEQQQIRNFEKKYLSLARFSLRSEMRIMIPFLNNTIRCFCRFSLKQKSPSEHKRYTYQLRVELFDVLKPTKFIRFLNSIFASSYSKLWCTYMVHADLEKSGNKISIREW